jgi:hypothetical protein
MTSAVLSEKENASTGWPSTFKSEKAPNMQSIRHHLATVFFASLAFLAAAAPSQAQDFAHYHKFLPRDAGTFRAMDVNPPENMTKLSEAAGNFSGQQWRFGLAGGGYVKLTTKYRGTDWCADIINDNGNPNDRRVHLTRCGNFTGQHWRLERAPIAAPASDAFYARITSEFLGTAMCLDHSTSEPLYTPQFALCDANSDRQIWLISQTGEAVPAP